MYYVFLYGSKRIGRRLPTRYVFEYVTFQDRSELRICWVLLHPHKYELVTSRRFVLKLTLSYICCHNIATKKKIFQIYKISLLNCS